MRHFATESGKSKGQFYTPAEVSRIMAQIVGIRNAKTSLSFLMMSEAVTVPCLIDVAKRRISGKRCSISL